MISPNEKLRRLGSESFINVDINSVILKSDLKFKVASGIIRFMYSDDSIKIPVYKMIILVDNKVYCYRKLSSRRRIEFDRYDSVIEFSDIHESKLYWNKYIKNDIIEFNLN